MSQKTNIEWCDSTFNAWEGCTKVGPGCDHCYAETRNSRFHAGVNWGPGALRLVRSDAYWREPLKWERDHAAFEAEHGRRRRVFCSSLADVFDNEAPAGQRARLFELIRVTPHLDWLLLTKRIGNVKRMLPDGWGDGWPNVWLGETVVNQEEADRDIPKLLAVPARVRFLSMEPLLSQVDLTRIDIDGHREIYPLAGSTDCEDDDGNPAPNLPSIDWVIAGGESGPGARPMNPAWVRELRDQCAAAGVPFLFKQWGEWHTNAFIGSTGASVFRQFESFQQWVNKASTWVQGGICIDRHGGELKNGGDMARARDTGAFPVTIMHKVGKHIAGRHLDGVTHDGYPEMP